MLAVALAAACLLGWALGPGTGGAAGVGVAGLVLATAGAVLFPRIEQRKIDRAHAALQATGR